MAKNVAEITDAQFESEVLGSDLPVLIDFWAPWCGPCRMLAPVVEQVADALVGKIKVLKMNVDDNPEVAGTYGIHSIPTLIWFKGGQKVEQVVGFSDEVSLKSKCLGVIG